VSYSGDLAAVVYSEDMHVAASRLEPVPGDGSRVRLAARVSYAAVSAPPEEYWFELPAGLAEDASRNGNPWLAALLPLASALGEPLEWEQPVDRPLVEGAHEVLRIWRAWYGDTRLVPLRGPVTETPRAPAPRRTCAFLSGGADSLFTALDHGDGSALEERGPIDEFLFVGGFDLRLEAVEGTARAQRNVEQIASALRRPLVFVRTNLREPGTLWDRCVNWGHKGHGPALVSIPLALGSRYDRVLIPASNIYAQAVPWGSTPLTDALLSSWTLRVRDDGAEYDRPDKIRAIASSEIARRHLRVCFKSTGGSNCGRCQKCLLAMLMLDTFVGLSACPTFPGPLDHRVVRALVVEKRWEKRHLRRLRGYAAAAGRRDIVGTIDALLGWRGFLRRKTRETSEGLFGRRAFLRRAVRRAFRTAGALVPGRGPGDS
jgi:hypothetical protein